MHDERKNQPDSIPSKKGPIISLILCSRSDQYQGDSRWRLQTALNYVGRSTQELGREEDVEVMVVDWGSQTPLRNLLKLNREASRIVSFMHVPTEVARVEQRESPFPEVIALNAAARRARGEYIGRIDQDTLVGRHFLKTFFWLHERQRLLVPLRSALLLSNRRRVPYRVAVLSPHLSVVERYVRWFGRFMPLMKPLPPHLFYQTFVGIWLLHRDVWFECGGYDEQFIHMDWQEVDMMLRLTPKYTLVNLGELTDHDLYHLDHAHPLGAWEAARDRKCNPVRDLDNRPTELYPNSENWGLNQYDLEILPPLIIDESNETRSVRQESKWLSFSAIVLFSGVQIAADSLILAVRLLFVRPKATYVTLKRRLHAAIETVSGQPIMRWPRLLTTRWSQRQFNQKV